MEEKQKITLPWYVIVGLMVVLSVIALILCARPLDTRLHDGETIPPEAITGPSKD
ncbi:hypothetical protein IKZ80_03565 [bacterium]|nr:hypothetical protein [bacterium]